jgi:C4-dicarboxylate-specific signal transduction histidine kinase
VDGRIALQKAIAKLQSTLEQREIKMHLQLPELISLVFASPLDLEVVIPAVLLAMIEDTYDADVIWVEVEEKDRSLIYHIHNNGIGISGNQLENLQDNQPTHESELLNFHNAVRCVNRWGGSLNITSEIGEGSKAELILRCFL